MKTSNSLALAVLLACLPISIRAESKDSSDGIRVIDIRVEFVEMTEPEATEFLHAAKPPEDSLAWRVALDKLLKEGRGKVVASTSVVTKSGQRATAESVQEHIYATEFDTPPGRKEHSPPVPAGLSAVDLPVATAFEMRPIGVRMEVDPVLGADGRTVDLNLAPEWTKFLGDDPILTVPHETGEREVQRMPRIYSMKVQTAVTLMDGGSALIGVNQPPTETGEADAGKRVLCFVSVRLVKA